jgi:short chain dehydrogenase
VIDFTDQAAIVTGAGRGLGRLYALELARRGASVVVNDLGGTMHGDGSDNSVADQVVAEIRAAGGPAVASYDSVDNPEGGQAIVDAAVDAFGRVDAVVSNAGLFNSIPFDQISPDDWRKMLRVHRQARAARRPVGDRGESLRSRMDNEVDVVDHRGSDRNAVCGADPDQGPIRPVLPGRVGRGDPLNKYLGDLAVSARAPIRKRQRCGPIRQRQE